MDNVLLTYSRIGLAYTGDVDGEAFTDESYAQMMTRAHRHLLAKPEAGLTLHWTGRAHTLPVQLEPALLKLLREDPTAYIRANSLPHRSVNLRTARKVAPTMQPLPSAGLRAGHDTLAAALGDRVYLRLHQGRVEHPGTGRWVDISELTAWLPDCDPVEVALGTEHGRGWITISTAALLRSDTVLFYLPRDWNTYGSWITKDQLTDLYNKYMEDKAKCLSEIK